MSHSPSSKVHQQLSLPGIEEPEMTLSKKKCRVSAPVFKPYHQHQMMLLPL